MKQAWVTAGSGFCFPAVRKVCFLHSFVHSCVCMCASMCTGTLHARCHDTHLEIRTACSWFLVPRSQQLGALLLFQRVQVWFATPTRRGLQTLSLTPVSGDPVLFMALAVTSCMWFIYRNKQAHHNINKMLNESQNSLLKC